MQGGLNSLCLTYYPLEPRCTWGYIWGLSLYHSVLVSCDPAYSRVVKAHVITDFFEGVLVDDMNDMNDMCSIDRPISG